MNLRGSDVQDVRFTGCQVGELDLGQLRGRRVAMVDTRIGRLDLQHADLGHVDLRGATYDELDGVGSLRGVTVTASQLVELAPLLAREAGITVLPADG